MVHHLTRGMKLWNLVLFSSLLLPAANTAFDFTMTTIGVPGNNFGGQEPGTNEEIQTFCKRNFDVTFPMMAKVSVKGDDIAPLYRHLTAARGGEIQWNFTKILVGKDGQVLQRFEPNVDPESAELQSAIERALR